MFHVKFVELVASDSVFVPDDSGEVVVWDVYDLGGFNCACVVDQVACQGDFPMVDV